MENAYADLIGGTPPGTANSFDVYIVSVLITAVIEFAVVYLTARKLLKLTSPFSKLLAAGTIPSIVTLTAVFLIQQTVGLTFFGGLMILEGMITIAEAFLIRPILSVSLRDAAILSLLANVASFLFSFVGIV